MARIKMVTRTVDYTVVEIMWVNTETAEVTVEDARITGDFKDENDIKKYITKFGVDGVKVENYVPVKVTITGTEEKLFGMSEIEFMKYAHLLPPRTASK